MLFRRSKPEAVKPIQFAELERYIGSLFDSHVSKGINSVDKSISDLVAEAAKFAELSDKFYSSDIEPDMEFIEHMSSGFMKSQKDLYAKSLSSILHEVQSSAQIVANTRYEEAKLKKEAFELIMQEILRLNSKFSMILVGYPRQMDAFKRQFSRMDKLLKGINDQLKGMSQEVGAYNNIIEKVSMMEESISLIEEIGKMGGASGMIRDEASEEKLRSAISTIGTERSSYESKMHSFEEEAKLIRHNITSLLQPLSRAARIYDHETKGKVRMAEFISNPISLLQGGNSYHVFESELLKMKSYISSNASKFKGHEAEQAHIAAVIKGNMPEMLARLRSLSDNVNNTKEKIAALTSRIHEMTNEKNKLEEKFGEMADREEKLRKSHESMLTYKGEIEKLCLDAYRVKIEIIKYE